MASLPADAVASHNEVETISPRRRMQPGASTMSSTYAQREANTTEPSRHKKVPGVSTMATTYAPAVSNSNDTLLKRPKLAQTSKFDQTYGGGVSDQQVKISGPIGKGGFLFLGMGVVGALMGGVFTFRYAKAQGSVLGAQLNSMFKTAHYYRGGFDAKMSRIEANKILNVHSSTSKSKIAQQYKKIMLANHPDKGGSPYLSAKINEAKMLLDKHVKS